MFFTPERIFLLLCAGGGYFFGLIQSAFIFSKIKKKDLRYHGSGNYGTTNAFRVLGAGWGILTFLCDLGKTVLAIYIASRVLPLYPQYVIDFHALVLYTGTGVILGHVFPVYLGFRGGKGVACAFATIVCLSDLKLIGVAILFFLLVFIISRYVSLASIVMVFMSAVSFMFFMLMRWTYVTTSWILDCEAVISLIFVIVLIAHRSNIVRLVFGEESKFYFRKRKRLEQLEEDYTDFDRYYAELDAEESGITNAAVELFESEGEEKVEPELTGAYAIAAAEMAAEAEERTLAAMEEAAEPVAEAEAEVEPEAEEAAEAYEQEVLEPVTEETVEAVEEVAETIEETTAEAIEESAEISEETVETAEEAVEEITEVAEDAAETVEDTAEEVAIEIVDTAEETVGDAAETIEEVTETVEEAAETVEDFAEQVTEDVSEAAEAVEETAEEVTDKAKTPIAAFFGGLKSRFQKSKPAQEPEEIPVSEAAEEISSETETTEEPVEDQIDEAPAAEEVAGAVGAAGAVGFFGKLKSRFQKKSGGGEDIPDFLELPESAEETVEETVEEVTETAEEALEDAKETFEEVSEEVTENVEETIETVEETAAEAMEEVTETAEDTIESAEEAADSADETIETIEEAAEVSAGAAGFAGFFGKLKSKFQKKPEKDEDAVADFFGFADDTEDVVEEAADNLEETAEEVAEEAPEEAADTMEESAETVETIAEDATAEFAEAVEDTSVGATGLFGKLKSKFQKKPEVDEEAVADFFGFADHSEEMTEEAVDTVEDASETIEDTIEEAMDSADDIAEDVTDTIEDAEETVAEATDTVEETIEETADTVEETIKETTDTVEEVDDAVEESMEEVTEVAEAIEDTPKEGRFRKLLSKINAFDLSTKIGLSLSSDEGPEGLPEMAEKKLAELKADVEIQESEIRDMGEKAEEFAEDRMDDLKKKI